VLSRAAGDKLEYHLTVFADYFQFYLQDEGASEDVSQNIWVGDAVHIGTARNMSVPVTIIVADAAPRDDDFGIWDHINECSLAIPSGRLVVAGCTDYFPAAPRLAPSADLLWRLAHCERRWPWGR